MLRAKQASVARAPSPGVAYAETADSSRLKTCRETLILGGAGFLESVCELTSRISKWNEKFQNQLRRSGTY